VRGGGGFSRGRSEEEMEGEEGLVRRYGGRMDSGVEADEESEEEEGGDEDEDDGEVRKETGWGGRGRAKELRGEMETERREALKWPVEDGEGWKLL